jgi:predicted DsbA family dithiol-disulfide isomerase
VRIEKLKGAFEVETRLVHFPLHPDTPPAGRSMAEVYAGRNIDPEAIYARMKGLMDAEGLPYGRRTHTYNSRLAQELGKWADTQPGGEAIHDALYRAYFVEARNIGDPEILVEIAQSVGLPAEEARAVLAERRFKEAVDADWAKSHAYGVTARAASAGCEAGTPRRQYREDAEKRQCGEAFERTGIIARPVMQCAG